MKNWSWPCLLVCIAASCAGCAVSKQITGPNGEVLHSIDCSGAYANMGMCLEKAGKICGAGGYEVLMGGASNHGTSATMGQYGFFATPIISREIIIRCKGVQGTRQQAQTQGDDKQNF